MSLLRRCEPASFGFLCVFTLLAGMAAVPWTYLAYRGAHLERQGIDIVHHAVLIHQASVPGGRNAHTLGELAGYPIMSHRLAAWALPLFGGDPVLAMRYLATVTTLLLLVAPYVLLCRVMKPMPALIVLVLWQLLCVKLKVAGCNHFMWEGQYNYSRAVGTAAFWIALVLLTGTPGSQFARLASWAAVIGLACVAMTCHIAPGAATFGAILLYAALMWAQERQASYLGLAGGTVVGAGLLCLASTDWLFMSSIASRDGWLPVGPQPVLLLWVPILLWACARVARAIISQRADIPVRPSADRIEHALTAALLASGLLQGYAIYKMLVPKTCAPYAVKSLFFLTFPVASLLGGLWLVRWAQQRAWLPAFERLARWKIAVPLVAAVLLVFFGHRLTRMDLGLRWGLPDPANPTARAVRPRPEFLPQHAVHAVKHVAGVQRNFYYYDPAQTSGGFYVSLVGLDVEWDLAQACLKKSENKEPAALIGFKALDGIVVPRSVDRSWLDGLPVSVEEAGDFWICRFERK